MSDARFLITAYGTYLSHHHDKLRTLPVPDDTCKFHFEYHHHHIAIRTHHYHFVGVNYEKQVYTTNHHHESQLFTIERMPDGRIALKNHHHHTYIGVDPYGWVHAHHRIEAGQLFTERPVYGGAVVGVAAPVVVAPPGQYVPTGVSMGVAPGQYVPPGVSVGVSPGYYPPPPAVVSTTTVTSSPGFGFGVGVVAPPIVATVYEPVYIPPHHHHHHHHHRGW